MRGLARRCADASDALERVTVVDDQLGRLTFTDQMAEGILWLLGYREGGVRPIFSATIPERASKRAGDSSCP